MTYGAYSSWSQAMKVFAKTLVEMPDNQPVKTWECAIVIVGNDHPDWARDLIKQFTNNGVLIPADKNPLHERTFTVDKEVIDELHWR